MFGAKIGKDFMLSHGHIENDFDVDEWARPECQEQAGHAGAQGGGGAPGPGASCPKVAVLVHVLNALVASVMLTLLMAYLVRQRSLLFDEIADETLASLTRQRWVSNWVWLIAVVVALVSPPLAVVLHVLAELDCLVGRTAIAPLG